MWIECSSCRAETRLSDAEQGAVVRCSACGKVRVAGGRISRSKSLPGSVDRSTLACGAGAVVVIAVLAVLTIFLKSPPTPATAPSVAPAPEPILDTDGWNGEAIRTLRSVYETALANDESALVKLLDGTRIARRLAQTKPAAVKYEALGPVEQQAFLQGVAQELMRGSDENSAHFWKPIEHELVRYEPLEIVVRITADRRLEPGATRIAESRSFDWHMHRSSEQAPWRVWAWGRFISEDERRLGRSRQPQATRTTLEDGTSLFQVEMRHLDPYPDTTPELCAQVEQAIGTMLDFSLRPPENNRARDELVAIGKPAIPMLLNRLCETKIVDAPDDPSLTQVAMVNETLRRITNYDSGFTALPGQSPERRTLALKAWFAWWEREGKDFAAPLEGLDLLKPLIVPTERDQREFEKVKAEGGGR